MKLGHGRIVRIIIRLGRRLPFLPPDPVPHRLVKHQFDLSIYTPKLIVGEALQVIV